MRRKALIEENIETLKELDDLMREFSEIRNPDDLPGELSRRFSGHLGSGRFDDEGSTNPDAR